RDDLSRVSDGQADAALTDVLVDQAYPTIVWMRERGVRWVLLYGRQAFEVDGKRRFWGGLIVEAVGGGSGLSDRLFELAEQAGVEVRYGCGVTGLKDGGGEVRGGLLDRGAEVMEGVVECVTVRLERHSGE